MGYNMARLRPRMNKVSSMPSLSLPSIANGKLPSLHQERADSPPDMMLEEYKPRGEDPYDSSLEDPKEKKKQLKRAHINSLKSKLNKSFQLSQELTRAIDISFSISSVKDSEAEIDKLLLKTRNSMLKFQEHKLDLRRERMLRAQGSKAKVDGKAVKTLIHAILSKLPQLVKPMLKECPSTIEKLHMINVCDQFERCALHYAAFMGNLTVCEKLLSAGASPSSKDYMLRTPLHFAVIGARISIIELLIGYKHHSEKKEAAPFFAHHRPSFAHKKQQLQLPDAIFLSKADLTEFASILQEMDGYATDPVSPSFQPTQVVDESRFIDCQDQFYRTPMHYAALKENYNIIKLLCSLGASLDLEDSERRRPADCTDHQAIKKFLISRMRINNAQGDAQ